MNIFLGKQTLGNNEVELLSTLVEMQCNIIQQDTEPINYVQASLEIEVQGNFIISGG